jgi:hypothetical protein
VSQGLPLGDPQFWVVTGAALLAVALLVLRRVRRRRAGRGGPECCPGCGECGRPPQVSEGPKRVS